MKNKGFIYILTNPSFPEYVKIGYADNVERRLRELNRSECIPFAFRLYAYYEVATRLSDKKIHEMIDSLNPNLRSVDEFDGKKRIREFYLMNAEEAYQILEAIATINGLKENLHLVKANKEQEEDEEEADKNRRSANPHHFKKVEFSSSLTGKEYFTDVREDGTLGVYEARSGEEIENNASPSKLDIIEQAIIDLGGEVNPNKRTTYQLAHQLIRMIDERES